MSGSFFKKEKHLFGTLVSVTAVIFTASLLLGVSGTDLFSEEGRWIISELRFPRAFLGFVVGASLALAGAVLQSLFRNPLADPHLTGISAGGAAGVVLGSFLFPAAVSLSGVPVVSAAGSIAALLLVYRLGRRNGILSTYTLLLAGVMVNSFLIALIVFLQSVSRGEEMTGVLFWLLGSLGNARAGDAGVVLAVLLPVLLLMLSKARALNVISLGESQAQALGVPVERTKKILFFLAALLTGTAVSTSGMISFIGLMAPHLARLLAGSDYRRLLPASALIGASLLMLSDFLARIVLQPQEIPAGVITSFLGVPFFLWLLKRHSPGRRFS